MTAPTIVLPSRTVQQQVLQLQVLLESGCVALISEGELPPEIPDYIGKIHKIDTAELKSPNCLIITFNKDYDWAQDLQRSVLAVLRYLLKRDIALTGAAIFPRKMTRHPFTVVAFDMSSVTLASFGYHLGAARYDRATLDNVVQAIANLPQVKRCSWSSPEIPMRTPGLWGNLVGRLRQQPDISQGRRRPPVTFTIQFTSTHSWIDPSVQGSVRRAIARVVRQSVVFDGYL